jgi:hypothetical protein
MVAGRSVRAKAMIEGTTFTVTLPRTPDMAQAPQYHGMPSIPLPAPDGDGPAGTAIRVLYIEDNPANIEVVSRLRANDVIAYLTKPLDLTELGQLVDSFAAGHNHEADPAPRTVPAP